MKQRQGHAEKQRQRHAEKQRDGGTEGEKQRDKQRDRDKARATEGEKQRDTQRDREDILIVVQRPSLLRLAVYAVVTRGGGASKGVHVVRCLIDFSCSHQSMR